MRLLLLFICTNTVFQLNAQSFPENFVGHWEGELLWYQSGKSTPKPVRMQLIIRPADSTGQFTWQLIYGEGKEDVRPYLLKPKDTAKGHWVIDELNGIVLDQFYTGNRFTGAFSVQNATIVNSYWREGNDLVAEFYSFSSKPIVRSGSGTEESPYVDSYANRAYQRAVLQKK